MSSLLVSMGLKAPPVDPAVLMKEWQRTIKKEIRRIERDIQSLERETKKHEAECKKLASRDRKAMMITAKSIIQSRRARDKMYMARATMSTISNQLATQASMVKVAGALGKSAEVMKGLNEIMKVGQMSADMQALSREMMKAGLVEEMLSEGMDEALGGGEEVEVEAAQEINAILAELVPDMPDAPWKSVAKQPTAVAPVAASGAAAEVDDDDIAIAALQARAEAL